MITTSCAHHLRKSGAELRNALRQYRSRNVGRPGPSRTDRCHQLTRDGRIALMRSSAATDRPNHDARASPPGVHRISGTSRPRNPDSRGVRCQGVVRTRRWSCMNINRSGPRRTLGAVGLLGCGVPRHGLRRGQPAQGGGGDRVGRAGILNITSAPVLTGQAALTIRGMGVDDRFTDGLALDIATLERLRVVEAVIDDRWEKRSVTYRGVLDERSRQGPSGSTAPRRCDFTALDDYEVTLPMKDLARPAMPLLATSADGERLAVEDRRPDAGRLPAAIGGRAQQDL